jgi:hypothetical protein
MNGTQIAKSQILIGVVVAVLLNVALIGENHKALHVFALDGRQVDPLAASAGTRATVLLFLSVACPISNRYAPEVNRLHARLAPQGVKFWLVYPNTFDMPAQIRDHLRMFGYAATPLRDPRQDLAKRVGATITPEAVVFDASGQRVYRGRIDNRNVSLGRERPFLTRRDLDEALTATLAGRLIEVQETKAVGCFIADFAPHHSF